MTASIRHHSSAGHAPSYLALALAIVMAAACQGGDRTDAPAATDAPASAAPLPPGDLDELAAVFDPLVEEFGLRTSRAALLDERQGYVESDSGRLLGLYFEPIDPYRPSDYVENIVPLMRAVVPAGFERWTGLEAIDVCQEPHPDENSAEIPPPVTQVYLTREAAAALDWGTLDLPHLLAAVVSREPPEIDFNIASEVADDPSYRDALEAAEELRETQE